MQYTFDGDCLVNIEPPSDDLPDGMSLGLGDEVLGCTAMDQE